MAKSINQTIRERQRRALQQANQYGLTLDEVTAGELYVWPPSAAVDLKSLRLPPQK